MRKLTIKRKWSFIECASKISLFIQFPQEESDVKIGDEYFKEFKLQNGKSVAVDIPNDETLVLILSSTMEASYTIPAGENEINLIASPKYAPMEGNPFKIEEVK